MRCIDRLLDILNCMNSSRFDKRIEVKFCLRFLLIYEKFKFAFLIFIIHFKADFRAIFIQKKYLFRDCTPIVSRLSSTCHSTVTHLSSSCHSHVTGLEIILRWRIEQYNRTHSGNARSSQQWCARESADDRKIYRNFFRLCGWVMTSSARIFETVRIIGTIMTEL